MNLNSKGKVICILNLEKSVDGKKRRQAIRKSASSKIPTFDKIFQGAWFLVETAFIFIFLKIILTASGLVLLHVAYPESEIGVDTNVTSDKKDLILRSDVSAIGMNITEECYNNYKYPIHCVGFLFMFIADILIICEAVIRFRFLIEFCKTGTVPERDLEKASRNVWLIMGGACLIADFVAIHMAWKMDGMSGTSVGDIVCMKDVVGFYHLTIIFNVMIMMQMFAMLVAKNRRNR